MRFQYDLFAAIDDSQDNRPLTKYLRRRAETLIGEYELPVGECINETIVRCIEAAIDGEDVVNALRYASRELNRAADAAQRAVYAAEDQEVSDG